MCPHGCTVLVAPDLPALDPTVDYGKLAEIARRTARLEALGSTRTLRGRPVRSVDVPFWTAPPGYCRWCGHPIDEWTKKGTRRLAKRWHEKCVAEYLGLASQQGFRAAVWERDHGRCADCLPGTPPCPKYPRHRPTLVLDQQGRPAEYGPGSVPAGGDRPHYERPHGTPGCKVPGCIGDDVHVRSREVEGPIDDREWQADHVVPLWAGGEHSMENAQTLCDQHHKAKTRREAGERARRRRTAAYDEIPLFNPEALDGAS